MGLLRLCEGHYRCRLLTQGNRTRWDRETPVMDPGEWMDVEPGRQLITMVDVEDTSLKPRCSDASNNNQTCMCQIVLEVRIEDTETQTAKIIKESLIGPGPVCFNDITNKRKEEPVVGSTTKKKITEYVVKCVMIDQTRPL